MRNSTNPLMKYPITTPTAVKKNANPVNFFQIKNHHHNDLLSLYVCLLYTSDAADEEDSVNIGGRGVIKKKKKQVKLTRRVKIRI